MSGCLVHGAVVFGTACWPVFTKDPVFGAHLSSSSSWRRISLTRASSSLRRSTSKSCVSTPCWMLLAVTVAMRFLLVLPMRLPCVLDGAVTDALTMPLLVHVSSCADLAFEVKLSQITVFACKFLYKTILMPKLPPITAALKTFPAL